MENEKHPSQDIEQNEDISKTHSISFDESHFGDREISQEVIKSVAFRGDSWIPGAINKWWAKICAENNFNPNDERLNGIMYHLIEVARNTFEKVGSGEIKVIFEADKITVVVSDQGHGFKDPNNDILPGHGLSEVKNFANEFIIETKGMKFTKVPENEELLSSQDTEVKQGSKITFSKNFE